MESQMVFKGVEYEIAPIEPGVWKYQILIGGRVKAGRTKTRLEGLADRRVQLLIDRELSAHMANTGTHSRTPAYRRNRR